MSDCCSETIPKPVSVLKLTSTTVDATSALTLSVDNSGAATGNKTINLQLIDEDGANVAATALIKLWFVDTNDKDAAKSLIFPDTPGANEIEIVTDENGTYALTVAHGGTLDEWYVCAEVLGLVYIDGPLNLGS